MRAFKLIFIHFVYHHYRTQLYHYTKFDSELPIHPSLYIIYTLKNAISLYEPMLPTRGIIASLPKSLVS